VTKDIPIPSDSARHWHLVAGDKSGGQMTAHGVYVVKPVTLPADTAIVTSCDNTSCFAQHWQALAAMQQLEILARIGQHLVSGNKPRIELPPVNLR